MRPERKVTWDATDLKKSRSDSLIIGTSNVRTLKTDESLDELEEALEISGIHILGISEVRRPIETLRTTNRSNLIAHSNSTDGQRGVGFIIQKHLIDNVIEFRSISDRLAILKLKLKSRNVCIMQVYAPTSASKEQDIDEFYHQLENALLDINTYYKDVFVMGDFNAQIGKGKN